MPIVTKEVISSVFYDELTGIPVIEDVRGDFHIVSMGDLEPGVSTGTGAEHYLQSIVTTNWPILNDFNKVPDYFNPGQFLDFVVPSGQVFNLEFLLASQDGNSVSTIGIFVDGAIKMLAPLRDNIDHHHMLLPVEAGSEVSVRFLPSGKAVKLSINVGGHLIINE